MSSWSQSWGSSWGSSWGAVVVTTLTAVGPTFKPRKRREKPPAKEDVDNRYKDADIALALLLLHEKT